MFRNKYNSPDLRTGLGHPFVDPLMLHDQVMDIDPPEMEAGIESALQDAAEEAADAIEDKAKELAKDFADDIKNTYEDVFGWIFDKLGQGLDYAVTEIAKLFKKLVTPVVDDYFWWIVAGLIIGLIGLIIFLKFIL